MQGLADAFILLGLPFDSPEAQQLNREIFETVYFAALEESTRLASVEGVSYVCTSAGVDRHHTAMSNNCRDHGKHVKAHQTATHDGSDQPAR